MGLCLPGLALSAEAKRAPDCASSALGDAMLLSALHKPEISIACDSFADGEDVDREVGIACLKTLRYPRRASGPNGSAVA